MKEKKILENLSLLERNETNQKEPENSIYPRYYCAKLPTMSFLAEIIFSSSQNRLKEQFWY